MNGEQRHLYVHVPFCSGKCAYCAFYSLPYDAAQGDAYLDGLARDMRLRAGRTYFDTVYIGGGTPSVLSPDQWRRLLDLVAPPGEARPREWTVEANPGTLTPAVIGRMVRSGVNRISLGVQSFDDAVLTAMRRRHGAAAVADTVAMVRAGGIANIGLDLIAGLPGVTEAGWRRTLENAVTLNPSHLSVYALGLEPGTPLRRQTARGEVRVPDDAAVLEALDAACAMLQSHGYPRYEISNFALPGRECLHNLACWRGEDYLGLGPAASSRVGRERWTNIPDLEAYVAALASGQPAPCESESLDASTDLVERLLFRFRLCEGVPVEALCRAHGEAGAALWSTWQPELHRLAGEGVLDLAGERWQTTARGREVLDAVLGRLMDVAG